MDFGYDATTQDYRERLLAFMDAHVYPQEAEFYATVGKQGDYWAWSRDPILRDLQGKARGEGLWNLFMPTEPYGAGLTNLQYAPLAEIMGRSPALGPPTFNCAAPDTGNMEVLVLAGEGAGFAIAQGRLGPGRIHHCMRSIGMAERAIELMCERVEARVAFGRPLADQGVIRQWIAQSRIEVEQLRLLTFKAAWLMDTVGVRGAHTEIQAIKVAAPLTVQGILDRAIQAHGGMGVSQDTPLAAMLAGIRTLRLADGPDEVHLAALGKHEIKRQRERRES